MSDGIVEFLTERLAEDERVARAGFSNQADPEHGWGASSASRTGVTPHVGIIYEDVQRAHVIRWHPGRVLAEVVAKRRIVEMHGGTHECPDDGENCGWIEDRSCDTLRLLALPHAEHADYLPEWAP